MDVSIPVTEPADTGNAGESQEMVYQLNPEKILKLSEVSTPGYMCERVRKKPNKLNL